MREIQQIVLHCSATPNGRPYGATDIDQWHKKRGWKGIGYHHVVQINGVVEGGRPHHVVGAHVKGHNHNSIGVCLIGTDQFSLAQWASAKDLVEMLLTWYPNAQVVGHRQRAPHKTCPGFDVPAWLNQSMQALPGHILEAA